MPGQMDLNEVLKNPEKAGYKEQEGVIFWKPEQPGEYLAGEVIEVDEEGQFGTQWVIEEEDGNISKTPSHGMLQSKMKDATVGDDVLIVLLELREVPGKEEPMRVYRVFIKEQ